MGKSLRALGLGALASSANGFVASPMVRQVGPTVALRTSAPPQLSFMQPFRETLGGAIHCKAVSVWLGLLRFGNCSQPSGA